MKIENYIFTGIMAFIALIVLSVELPTVLNNINNNVNGNIPINVLDIFKVIFPLIPILVVVPIIFWVLSAFAFGKTEEIKEYPTPIHEEDEEEVEVESKFNLVTETTSLNCGYCGAPLPLSMRCGYCGRYNILKERVK